MDWANNSTAWDAPKSRMGTSTCPFSSEEFRQVTKIVDRKDSLPVQPASGGRAIAHRDGPTVQMRNGARKDAVVTNVGRALFQCSSQPLMSLDRAPFWSMDQMSPFTSPTTPLAKAV